MADLKRLLGLESLVGLLGLEASGWRMLDSGLVHVVQHARRSERSADFLRKAFNVRSRIKILGSEGVYLEENCGANPSRYLLGSKTPVKKIKKTDFGVSGVSGV